jgi:hypothetical protein
MQKGMRHVQVSENAPLRSFSHFPFRTPSIDKKLGFRRGEAPTFCVHMHPGHTQKHNGLLSKILDGNHISNCFSSTRHLRHCSARKTTKTFDGAISRTAETQQ